jgi:hypothetical protein
MPNPAIRRPWALGRDYRTCALIGTGHFLSHFYMLCLPPLFLLWRDEFDVSYAMSALYLLSSLFIKLVVNIIPFLSFIIFFPHFIYHFFLLFMLLQFVLF